MVRCRIRIFLLLMMPLIAEAQQVNIDSLIREVHITRNDTAKLIMLRAIAREYAEVNPDSAFPYAEKSLQLARQLHLPLDEVGALREMAYSFSNRGNYPRSLQTFLAAMAILNDPESEKRVLVGKFPGDDALDFRMATPHAQRLNQIAFTHQGLGMLYTNFYHYEKSWHHHLLARQKAEEAGNVVAQSIINLTMTRVYLNLKKNDSALFSIRQAYDQLMKSGYKRYLGSVLLNMGRTYAALGNRTLANDYYRKSLVASKEQGYFRGVVASRLLLADYYSESGNEDSAFLYIMTSLSEAKKLNAPDLMLRTYTSLTRHYRNTRNNDSIVKYQGLIIKINDSQFNAKQAQQFQNIDFEEQQRQEEVEAAQQALRTRWRMYALLAGLSIILFIAIMLWRNSQQRKRANLLLSKQKAELESTLSTLKATQSQLIQSEKMASLGELTAGIAHEIQNPLNFVNNFSDVNKELIEELKSEKLKVKSERDEDLENQILNDLAQNLDKINHHGKRADAIVKGMLQHSRTTTGQKELTDINALADEYFRLAYHGLRAKDKTFNATMTTDFDDSIAKINIIPQDIGRVILNLINNAFYAVDEKKKLDQNEYEPTVSLSTKKVNGKVEVRVKDNGNGIPQKVLDKIFQPFFTTKPTGQGTGLGLSLAYDIVKAHGGELNVRTKEGQGTEFVIILPSA